ncbi:hypothetical protein HMPREF9554_02136 [Treponema phagedenis F0421]|nr:hypothetical protein HMPREF9554_02136 [Treponema phagedenis F0421]
MNFIITMVNCSPLRRVELFFIKFFTIRIIKKSCACRANQVNNIAFFGII